MTSLTVSASDSGRLGESARNQRRSSSFRPDIQGLRALAVIAVVAYHAGLPVPGGFVGVDIFFVISGYVISGLLGRELSRTGRICFTQFYLRRARRLMPAAALMISVTVALSAILISPVGTYQQSAGQAASAASIFMANAYFYVSSGGYFQTSAEANPFLHMWSLSVEEQFYFAFPLFLMALWILARYLRRRWVIAVLIALGAGLSFVLCIVFTYGLVTSLGPLDHFIPSPIHQASFAFFSPFTRAWEFLTGAAIAVLFASKKLSDRWASPLAWVGVGLLACSLVLLSDGSTFPGVWAALPVTGTAAMIVAGTSSRRSGPTRALSASGVIRIGDISYSWYLWHWPLIVFAAYWFPGRGMFAVLAAAFSLVPATASYFLVERPIHLGLRWSSSVATGWLVALGVMVPFLAGALLVAGWQNSWNRTDLTEIQSTIGPGHVDAERGCASDTVLGPSTPAGCLWTVPRPKGTALLIGDSNAGHLTEAAVAATQRLDLNLQVVTSGGCPMVIAVAYPTEQCGTWVEGNLQAIEQMRQPFSAVILSNSVSYPQAVPERFVDPANEQQGEDPAASAERGWAQGTRLVVDRISRVSPVVLAEPIPHLGADYPTCLSRSFLLPLDLSCGRIDPESVRTQRDATAQSVRTAVGSRVKYLDLSRRICDEERFCDVTHSGTLWFRDAAHLSVQGALRYATDLEVALKRAAE